MPGAHRGRPFLPLSPLTSYVYPGHRRHPAELATSRERLLSFRYVFITAVAWPQSHQDKGTVLVLKPMHVTLSDGVTQRGISCCRDRGLPR